MIHSGTKALTAYRKVIPLLALAFTFLGASEARAQVRLGVIGGLHSANILEKNNIPNWDSTVKPFQSSLSGFQLGFILEMPLGHKGFFFQPAIAYTVKGRKYTRNNDSATSHLTDTIYSRQDLHTNYIDVPLNITYKLYLSANHKNSFFLSAGPQISFFYSGKTTSESLAWINDSTTKYSNESESATVGKGTNAFKTVDIGINGRVGFEFGNVMLSVYFSRGLSNSFHSTYDGTFHNKVMGASLGIWLSSTGVPVPPKKKDTDLDGIPDEEDACPLKPGTAKWHGCPVPDTDHDGIDDDHDSCRNQAGLARYNGCPIPDSDHDGVNDEEDKCPDKPGLARYNGCPIPDRDGDGVNDEEDKCPDTPGTIENHGCPEIRKETTEKVNYIARNIMFNSSSDQLTDSSYLALDVLAALMKDHPEWHLTIEGYTDSSGRAATNLLLSQKRALAVKNYLVKKGIDESHLTAIGRGQERPIADNRTPAGRAINRRVELNISQENK
ncbi:MAG TPA: OmpA family protein [Puia sp.]|nr:OmpA family protein [Puia sp.]